MKRMYTLKKTSCRRMKNVWTILFLFLVIPVAQAQSKPDNEIPYIEVTGSADIEIEPDEMRLMVVISGYEEEKKQPVKLEAVEKRLMDILSGIGLPKNSIILKNASTQGYWYYWWKEEQEKDARVSKQYEIIFTDYSQLNRVLTELPGPKEGFLNVSISELKNKKIAEYRKQTKIEAIKAAKEKAGYLLESVGNVPGKLLQVIELDEDDWGGFRPYAVSNAISQTSMQINNNSGDMDSSIRKIKLRYRIKARFEILQP